MITVRDIFLAMDDLFSLRVMMDNGEIKCPKKAIFDNERRIVNIITGGRSCSEYKARDMLHGLGNYYHRVFIDSVPADSIAIVGNKVFILVGNRKLQ